MARYCRGAFLGCRPWRYLAAVRSRAAIRGSFFASCVPEGASDGKNAPSWQHIAAMHPKRAGFGKICAPCIRKAPQTGVRGCTARRSCQEGALFAARAPQIMHGARILPFLGAPFERFGLSLAGRGRCSRFAHCPLPLCAGGAAVSRARPHAASSCSPPPHKMLPLPRPLRAPLRPVCVAGSACLVAHKQLLLARGPVVASASRPNW